MAGEDDRDTEQEVERVRSPYHDPELFYYQYEALMKKYRACKQWAKDHPDRMNSQRRRKLAWLEKDVYWHEYLWDRFKFNVMNPRETRRAKVTAKVRPSINENTSMEPLNQSEMEL